MESENGRRVAGERPTMKPNRCWRKSCPSDRLPSSETWRKQPSSATWNAWPGLILDLEHLLPSAEKLDNIREAFDVCGSDLLRPAWEFLGTQCTYDELRLARIYLRQEEMLSD